MRGALVRFTRLTPTSIHPSLDQKLLFSLACVWGPGAATEHVVMCLGLVKTMSKLQAVDNARRKRDRGGQEPLYDARLRGGTRLGSLNGLPHHRGAAFSDWIRTRSDRVCHQFPVSFSSFFPFLFFFLFLHSCQFLLVLGTPMVSRRLPGSHQMRLLAASSDHSIDTQIAFSGERLFPSIFACGRLDKLLCSSARKRPKGKMPRRPNRTRNQEKKTVKCI